MVMEHVQVHVKPCTDMRDCTSYMEIVDTHEIDKQSVTGETEAGGGYESHWFSLINRPNIRTRTVVQYIPTVMRLEAR